MKNGEAIANFNKAFISFQNIMTFDLMDKVRLFPFQTRQHPFSAS